MRSHIEKYLFLYLMGVALILMIIPVLPTDVLINIFVITVFICGYGLVLGFVITVAIYTIIILARIAKKLK